MVVERERHRVALDVDGHVLGGLALVAGVDRELHALRVGVDVDAHDGHRRGDGRHAAERAKELLGVDGDRGRVGLGQELAVVGIGALGLARDIGGVAEGEDDLVGGGADEDLLGERRHGEHVMEDGAGDDERELRRGGLGCGIGLAHRQAVGVGGYEPQGVVCRGEQNALQDGARILLGGDAVDLVDHRGEYLARQLAGARELDFGELRPVLGVERVEPEERGEAGDGDGALAALEDHSGIGKVLHDALEELARDHGLARFLDVGRDLMADRDGEVVGLELERSVGSLDVDAGEQRDGRIAAHTLADDRKSGEERFLAN